MVPRNIAAFAGALAGLSSEVFGWANFASELAEFQNSFEGSMMEVGDRSFFVPADAASLRQRSGRAREALFRRAGGLGPVLADDGDALASSPGSVEGVLELATEWSPTFRSFVETVAQCVPRARAVFEAAGGGCVKSRGSLQRKVDRNAAVAGCSTGFAARHVADALRGTVVVGRPEDIELIIRHLNRSRALPPAENPFAAPRTPLDVAVVSVANGLAAAGGRAPGAAAAGAVTVGLRLTGDDRALLAELRIALGDLMDGTEECPEAYRKDLLAAANAGSESVSTSVREQIDIGAELVSLFGMEKALGQGITRQLRGASGPAEPEPEEEEIFEAVETPMYHYLDGVWYRGDLADAGAQVQALQQDGSWALAPISAAALAATAASSTLGPSPPVLEGNASGSALEVGAAARRLGCSAISAICFINAECCSARCVSTRRCGPTLR